MPQKKDNDLLERIWVLTIHDYYESETYVSLYKDPVLAEKYMLKDICECLIKYNIRIQLTTGCQHYKIKNCLEWKIEEKKVLDGEYVGKYRRHFRNDEGDDGIY